MTVPDTKVELSPQDKARQQRHREQLAAMARERRDELEDEGNQEEQ